LWRIKSESIHLKPFFMGINEKGIRNLETCHQAIKDPFSSLSFPQQFPLISNR
jgi:hypothetical protein